MNLKQRLLTVIWIILTLSVITFILSPYSQKLVTNYYLNKNISIWEKIYADYEEDNKKRYDIIAEQERMIKENDIKKEKLLTCIELNQDKTLTDCRKVIKEEKLEVVETKLPPQDVLIVCWHWMSNWFEWQDNWAIFWNKTERKMILEFAEHLIDIWYKTYWCLFDNKLDEKIDYINNSDFNYIYELHFDKRPENWLEWTKILFWWNWWWIWQVEANFNKWLAYIVCEWIDVCRTQNAYWLKMLNSTNKPTVIIEIADPNQSNFEKYKNDVLDFFKNLK